MTTPTSPPEGFKVSKSIRDELDPAVKDSARAVLWAKSSGRCALCNEPLPPDGKLIDIDHMVAKAEGTGGETTLNNLYLSHRACNRSRKNLPFDLARRVIQFGRWCTAQPRRSFSDVIDKYVDNGNLRAELEVKNGEVLVRFGADERRAPLYLDPATDTSYFFMNAPVTYIRNDDDSQPRYIENDHVRVLATEFYVRPVHEPSNCRVILSDKGVADLLQFDGQHKTTAQIVLGRHEVPMKFYLEPNEAMIQELVVQIQQGIKKRPLSTTDTLKKLDDVVRDKISAYRDDHNGLAPSEVELVEYQPKQDQTAFKKRLLSNFAFAVLDDPGFELAAYASKKPDTLAPFTDTVLVNRLIVPLISQDLQNEPLDNSVQRDTERATVIRVLNRIHSNMLEEQWHPSKSSSEDDQLLTQRARVFFYQGAIGWWLGEILLPAFKLNYPKPKWRRLFLEELSSSDAEKLDEFVDIICGWDIWSTTDTTKLAAFRSNTVANVSAAIPEYDNTTLLKEYTSKSGG